ncbi:MAG TPA: serine/threonine-protein kinase [Planctomycetota bacterium]|nr:serine/threonine-protein kinase [Planctomycetota bacterium]
MDSARWARVRSILERAMDVAGPQLEALLARECGDDPELRGEVESLLAVESRAVALEPPPRTDLAQAMADPNLGRRIGPYTIERVLGTGGMGVVYLAHRSGADFEQRVALKLIKRGMDTDDILRQFRRERAVLAGLEHPNIARLYDGGATEDGLPWFAMEYIEGRPIHAWCDEQGLGVRARIELFISVCSAVSHAHQRLIVHRDLKPSNILVARDGTVRLLDFGIAKVLVSDTAEETVHTLADQRRLTPDYASPEQLRGEVVSTATDVYSLGVVLYEVLSGENPFHGTPITDRGTPVRPSTRAAAAVAQTGAAKARRPSELRGDLDTITLTALAPEVTQRYASVEALERDLRRHQQGMPIQARPATAGYRARKFIGRNRLAVAATAAIFISLLGGLAFARSGYLEALRQRGVAETRRVTAEKESRRANSVLKLTRDMLGSASPHDVRSKDYTLRELLDEFDARLDGEHVDEPEVEASVREIMSRSYRELGILDKAQRHLDRAFALLPGARESNEEISLTLECDAIDLLHDQGEYVKAEAECTRILERLEQFDPSNDVALDTRVALLTSRGDFRAHTDRLDEAEVDLRAALAMLTKREPVNFDQHRRCLDVLAGTLERKGSTVDALALASEALELARSHTGNHSEVTSTALNNLGHIAMTGGDFEKAELVLREALAIERELHDGPHSDLAPILANLGTTLRQRGDYAAAEPLAREAVEVARKTLGPKHPSLASDLSSLGTVLQQKGDYEGAEVAMTEALELRLALYGEENLQVARSRNNLGLLLRMRGKLTEAEEMLRSALAVRRKLLGDRDVAVAATLSNLSGLLAALGDIAGAETAAREAVSIHREVLGPVHADLASSLATLSGIRLRQKDFVEARALIEEALAMRRQLNGPEHPDIARLLSNLGDVLVGAGELALAEQPMLEAEAMQRKLLNPTHPHLARTLYSLGDLAERGGHAPEAAAYMREVLAIRRKALGDANGDTRDAASRLAEMLVACGDADGARDVRRELGIAEPAQEAAAQH